VKSVGQMVTPDTERSEVLRGNRLPGTKQNKV